MRKLTAVVGVYFIEVCLLGELLPLKTMPSRFSESTKSRLLALNQSVETCMIHIFFFEVFLKASVKENLST